MTWMLTATGQQVDLRCIATDALRIEDIAHHLALINRWSGATSRPYSVAEHSLLVVRIMEVEHGITSPSALLAGLLHDAHEAYTGDLTSPMKQIIGDAWHAEEQRIQHAVRAHFDILVPSAAHAEQIKTADLQALATEWRDLVGRPELMPPDLPAPVGWIAMAARPVRDWTCLRDAFLERFFDLVRARAEQARELRAPAAPDDDEPTAQHRAERLGETLRLATAIADDSARCDIECHCVAERMGQHTWYDTRPGATPDGADNADLVATALRYLRLREHVVTHPAQEHLVRFEH